MYKHLCNPKYPKNPDSKLFIGNIPKKQPRPQSSVEIMRAAAIGLNQDFQDL
jgi:hypothetical protein